MDWFLCGLTEGQVAPNSCESGKELRVLYIVGTSLLAVDLFASQGGVLQGVRCLFNFKTFRS